MEHNPFLEQENYFAAYQQNIDNLKNNPEVIAFDKLCYEVFEHQESGRLFLEEIRRRFFMRSMVSKGAPTYQIDVLWQEGFRDAWMMVINAVMAHKQRIKAETK